MKAIFLSASVPVPGRGDFADTANPFLIQSAVREFVSVVLGRRLLVWGGHPAITPMVWAVCNDLGVNYAQAVMLYQSRYFKAAFPDENKRFGNVAYIDGVDGNRERSLGRMREEMLSREDLEAAVLIGGMEGVVKEERLFRQFHPGSLILPVPAPGGAARKIALRHGLGLPDLDSVDFATLFYTRLGIAPDDRRETSSQS